MSKSIKKQLISGVFYTAVSKYSGIILQIVVAAVLSRLLPPKEFGTIAIASIIIAFFSIITDSGISPAIVQNKELDDDDYDNIYTFTIYFGLIVSIAFYFLSIPISLLYENSDLIPVCQILSLQLFFASINIVPNGILLKNKRFKLIGLRTLIIQILTGSLSIVVAYKGGGIYALLVAPILSGIFLYISNISLIRVRFKRGGILTSVSKIAKFSIFQLGFNVLNFFARNIDKLLVGKVLGMTPLGYYSKSYRLMMMPLQNISHVFTPALQPILSEFQNQKNILAEKYLKLLKLLGIVSFPLSVYLFYSGREIILLLFGDQWEKSVFVFCVLSLTVSVQVLNSTAGAIYQSANSTKNLFVSGVFGTVILVVGLVVPIFIYRNIEAVAIGYTIAQFLNFVQTFVLLFNTLSVSITKFLKVLIVPVVSVVLIYLMYELCGSIFEYNLFYSFIYKSSLLGLSYIVLLYMTYPSQLKNKISWIKNRF